VFKLPQKAFKGLNQGIPQCGGGLSCSQGLLLAFYASYCVEKSYDFTRITSVNLRWLNDHKDYFTSVSFPTLCMLVFAWLIGLILTIY
jgi:hypothetical protein